MSNEIIKKVGSLEEGKYYKKAHTDEYLGKYSGKGIMQEHPGDFAFFSKPYGYSGIIQILPDGRLVEEVKKIEYEDISPVAEVGAGASQFYVPLIQHPQPQPQPQPQQQQWLHYTQLTPGRYYTDQNNTYLGKYKGIIYDFEKHSLREIPWEFYFRDVTPQQRGGKRSRRSKRKAKRHTRKH